MVSNYGKGVSFGITCTLCHSKDSYHFHEKCSTTLQVPRLRSWRHTIEVKDTQLIIKRNVPLTSATSNKSEYVKL